MGGKRWSKLSAPLNNLEPDEVQDWNNQEACFFCSSDKHDAVSLVKQLLLFFSSLTSFQCV